jgi:hypothetical protein
MFICFSKSKPLSRDLMLRQNRFLACDLGLFPRRNVCVYKSQKGNRDNDHHKFHQVTHLKTTSRTALPFSFRHVVCLLKRQPPCHNSSGFLGGFLKFFEAFAEKTAKSHPVSG